MPLRALFFAGLITLGAAALAVWLHAPTSTDANIVPGEYSMEVDVAPTQVALGDYFTAQVGVFHQESEGFQAAQWFLEYDESVVDVTFVGTHPDGPVECVQKNDDGSRVLMGCLTFIPNGFTFSNWAFNLLFRCIANGTSPLTLEFVGPPNYTAIIRSDSELQPVHVHNDAVECSDAVPTGTPFPVSPTPTPIAGPRGGVWDLHVMAPFEADVGAPFNAAIQVFPADSLGYRIVQWWIVHDVSLLQRLSIAREGTAPTECQSYAGAAPPYLLACGTDATNGFVHDGTAFNVTYACLSPGPAEIAISPQNDPGGFRSYVLTGEWANGFEEQTTVNSVTIECVEPLPFIGLVKAIDGELPEEGEGTQLRNLWLCYDQSTDGIDNDGDSTVDNESATCDANGEGYLDVEELVFAPRDCDTRNDDDDSDGRPVDGSVADGSSTAYVGSNPRPECRQPTLEDFIQDEVDKDGGEVPEGLGAIEFQIKFDHKIFDIMVSESDDESDGIDNDGDTMLDEPDEDWANGRFENCSMTIISENDIRFGCVTSGAMLGHLRPNGISVADIRILPEADLRLRIRPGKDNGVVRRILQENCEVADIFGDIFPHTNAGLTPACTDLDITVRRLEGDLDTDCDVTIIDAQRVAFRYGAFFGQLLYDPHFDLEPFVAPDFDIDIKDLQFVFGRVGSTCDAPVPNNQDPVAAQGVGQP